MQLIRAEAGECIGVTGPVIAFLALYRYHQPSLASVLRLTVAR